MNLEKIKAHQEFLANQPEARALQRSLKNGDQIICTEEAFFTYSGCKELAVSQLVGDMVYVNGNGLGTIRRPSDGEILPTIGNSVQGALINQQPYHHPLKPKDSRPNRLGLCTGLNVGTFRLATHEDPGYLDTRDGWSLYYERELKRERAISFIATSAALVLLSMLLTQMVPA